MAYDINKLRQQAIFSQIPDMSGGTMDMDMLNMGAAMPTRPYDNLFQYPEAPPPRNNGVQPPSLAPPRVPTYEQPQIDTSQGGLSSRDLDIMKIVNETYSPATKSRDRFDNLLDNMPQRNKPSWARKLVAGGIGVGSQNPIEDMEKVMYAPYNRDMETFKAKTGPFAQAMQAENTANVNERSLTGNLVTASVNAKRYEMQNEAATERNRINRIKTQMGPGWTMNARGPTVIVQNRATGEVKDTGIKTGWMDEADKIEAEGEWDVKAARARGEAAIAQDWIPMQDPFGNRYYVNPNVTSGQKMVPAPGSPETPQGPLNRIGTPRASDTDTPKEAGERQQLQWQKLRDIDPSVAKWTIKKPNGKIELVPDPGSAGTGKWNPFVTNVSEGDVQEYNEVKRKLYPDGNFPTTTPKMESTTKPAMGTGPGGYSPQGTQAAPAKPVENTVPDAAQPGRSIRLPPPTQPGVQPQIAYSKSRNAYGISYDGGKTWRPYTPTFVGQ